MTAVLTMAVVNTATDTITTAPAHGLVTGDPCVTRNTSGGAQPTGLAPVTTYYAIRVDATNVKLATSSANALAGTAIDLTTAGTGTNVIEVGIPYLPRTVYAALSQLKSLDLNEIQAALTSLWRLLTGQAQTLWTTVTLAVSLVLGANQDITLSGTGRYRRGSLTKKIPVSIGSYSASNGWAPGTWTPAALNNQLALPLVLDAGERILAVTAKTKCGATDVFTVTCYRYDASAGTLTSLGSAVSANHASALETVTVTLGTPETVSTANEYQYIIHVQATAFSTGTQAVHGATATTDVP